MSSHMPPIPPANRSKKGPEASSEAVRGQSWKHPEPQNTSEQGYTANIKQNTTNKGFFRGRWAVESIACSKGARSQNRAFWPFAIASRNVRAARPYTPR